MPEHRVRFTEQFFDQLDLLLPDERGTDGTPSVTDFLLLDLPTVRDELAADFDGRTFATKDPEVRVYIGTGVLVPAFAVYVARDGDSIDAFWITVDLSPTTVIRCRSVSANGNPFWPHPLANPLATTGCCRSCEMPPTARSLSE